jgi:FkbM family methyltransferase
MGFLSDLTTLVGHITHHPNNRGRRLPALGRLAYWQVRKRLLHSSMIVAVEGRRRFKVVPDSRFSSLVFYNRLPDWDEMNFLLRVLRPRDGFLDIGANVGFYTILASTATEGPLVAIEASPRNVAVLHDQIRLNGIGHVKVLELAVGDVDGELPFDGADRETGGLIEPSSESPLAIRVPCRRLDGLLDDAFLDRCLLAKIDIEGNEVAALRGASRILADRRIPCWIFELSSENLRGRGSSEADLIGLFESNGYEILYWDEDRDRLGTRGDADDVGRSNYLACCDRRRIDDRLRSGDAGIGP